MRSLRFHIAVSLVFLLLPLTEAGVIKNVFTSLIGGKDAGKNEENQKQPAGYAEYEHRTPGHDASTWHPNDEDYRSPGSKPSGQYGAGGTYTKKPVVVDGTTEKYKNTSWYIENEDYLSPNKNETKQQRPSSQYGAAGTYTMKPVGGTTERFPVNGNYMSGNQQQRPNEFTNINNNYNNYNERPIQDNTGDGYVRAKGTTRSSITSQNATELKSEGGNDANSIVLQAEGVTCCFSNLKDKMENRNLRCNEMDCHLDKTYEKSSLWVCGAIKCTVASVDFSQDHGSKKLLECSDGRNIITVQDKPVNCGPNEKVHNGKCRKVFGERKPDIICGF